MRVPYRLASPPRANAMNMVYRRNERSSPDCMSPLITSRPPYQSTRVIARNATIPTPEAKVPNARARFRPKSKLRPTRRPYRSISLSSLAKLRTVRMFPRTSPATIPASARAFWYDFEIFRTNFPKTTAPIATKGMIASMIPDSVGESTNRIARPATDWTIHRSAIDTFTVSADWIEEVSEASRFTSSELWTLSKKATSWYARLSKTLVRNLATSLSPARLKSQTRTNANALRTAKTTRRRSTVRSSWALSAAWSSWPLLIPDISLPNRAGTTICAPEDMNSARVPRSRMPNSGLASRSMRLNEARAGFLLPAPSPSPRRIPLMSSSRPSRVPRVLSFSSSAPSPSPSPFALEGSWRTSYRTPTPAPTPFSDCCGCGEPSPPRRKPATAASLAPPRSAKRTTVSGQGWPHSANIPALTARTSTDASRAHRSRTAVPGWARPQRSSSSAPRAEQSMATSPTLSSHE
mmetsp:Transcript_20944/g.51307  ORF Transcript_20944/g.51307 Transcript_20944/m.51307 type:complete len:465 (-) Transcript_20944:299-1693(-)